MFQNYFLTAIRNILRTRYFSVIIIAGLALGIAAFGLVYNYVSHELSFDKFNEHYHSVYRLETPEWALTGTAYAPEISAAFPEIVNGIRVSCWEGGNVTVRIEDRMLSLDNLIYADSGFFDVFSFRFLSGNPQTCMNTPNSVVLTTETARKLFGNDDPVGRSFKINNKVILTVTGIIEDVADFHLKIHAVTPFKTLTAFYDQPDFLNQYGTWNYYTYFRLKENADKTLLEKKINAFYKGRIFWEDREPEFSLRPLKELYFTQVKNDFPMTKASKPMLRIYMLVAVFILIIACVNFINLAIAKAGTRIREIGVRKVTGAGKKNLIIQFMGESVIYAFISMIIGIIIMDLIRPVFNSLVQRDLELFSSGWAGILILVFFLPLTIGVVAGFYPAMYLTGFNVLTTLKGLKTRVKESLLFRRTLIIIQFTISIALIISTFTVYKQLRFMRSSDPGYNRENVILLPMNRSLDSHYEAFRSMLLQNPSVKGMARSTQSLENVGWQESLDINTERKPYTYLGTDTEFMTLMGLTMAEGRTFRPDSPSDSGKVIINEQAVAYFGLKEPVIGSIIGTGERRLEVLGVARDFHFRSMHSPISPLVIGLRKDWLSTVNIRIDQADPEKTIRIIESAWNKLSPEYQFEYRFLDQNYENLYNNEKRLARTFVYLAILAIFIACIGLLGLSSFMTERRIKEIGIRKTLGDTTQGIVMRLSAEFGALVLIAGFISAPVAFFGMKAWLNTFAYHVSMDALIIAGACIIALLIALVTVYIQINRIANRNPVEALRYE
ncbi:MAG TPA: ABC transporter permease [Bacteroidales bacterium]|nr:ABC transporter permease [Bacteroidales bacterium]